MASGVNIDKDKDAVFFEVKKIIIIKPTGPPFPMASSLAYKRIKINLLYRPDSS